MLIKKQTKEKDIQNYLKDQLKHLPNCWARKWSDRYLSNIPDYVIAFDGQVVFCELKKPLGKARAGQVAEGNRIIEAGACWLVCSTVEEVDQLVEGLRHGKFRIESKTKGRC